MQGHVATPVGCGVLWCYVVLSGATSTSGRSRVESHGRSRPSFATVAREAAPLLADQARSVGGERVEPQMKRSRLHVFALALIRTG